MEESQSNMRYVYLQTIRHLWRFDFENRDSNSARGSCKGLLTKLIDFQKEEVPLGAGGFVFNSKLFFVGGEMVKTDTPRIKLAPLGSFDDNDEFDSILSVYIKAYDSLECLEEEFGGDSEGYLKLPRGALNKQVFVLDPFVDSKIEPIVPSISVLAESESEAPKTRPFVVPINKEGTTLIYVLSHTPLFYKHTVPKPKFEVFDPHHNSWETLQEPPIFSSTDFDLVLFEFGGKIFLISQMEEIFFDLETKEWQSSFVFELARSMYMPTCMINVFGDVYVGCAFDVVCAYQLGPDNRVRIQPLDLQIAHCSKSTLCNLCDGIVQYVSTACFTGIFHFDFVKFQISILKKNSGKLSRRAYSRRGPEDFVSVKIIDSLHRSAVYEYTPYLDEPPFVNAYVL